MASRFLTAVITNAACTPGMALAQHLASAGYDLILVDIERTRLDSFADTLTTRTRQAVEVLATDVRCPLQRRRLIDHIARDESIVAMFRVEKPTPTARTDATLVPADALGGAMDALVHETLAGLVASGRTPDVCKASVIFF